MNTLQTINEEGHTPAASAVERMKQYLQNNTVDGCSFDSHRARARALHRCVDRCCYLLDHRDDLLQLCGLVVFWVDSEEVVEVLVITKELSYRI